MAFVELGPVTSRIVQAVGETADRMTRNPHKLSFVVEDRFGRHEFGTDTDFPLPAPAPLRAAEKADAADLQRLRGALYAAD